MTFSPRTLVGGIATLALLACVLAISLALRAPLTGLGLVPTEDAGGSGLRVTASAPAADAGPREGAVIVAFHAGGERVPAQHLLLVEDPDGLPSWEEYRSLMSSQAQLAGAAADNTLAAELADGSQHALPVRQRHLDDLPFMFWLQLLFGIGAVMTGALVLAGRPDDLATRLYALTGFFLFLSTTTAAVYSTRELVFDGEIFRLLSLVNHVGAVFFSASLTSLLWVYPTRLRGLPVVWLCYLAGIAAMIVDVLQLSADNTWSPTAVLSIFLFSFVFAGMQWWKTREAPADRAALRWFLLSIYVATGLFAGVILIPNALGIPPPASQGVMFGAFLVMYWGLALGIVRYRLFQLAQWWSAIWGWFVGGVAVVLVDVLLVSSLALSDALALSISVAVVGWLYFPVRQWLWTRLARRERTLAEWLPDILPILIDTQEGHSGEEALRARWPVALKAVFRPLAVETAGGPLAAAEIRENGLALAVPDPGNGRQHQLLRHAGGGARLFTGADLATLAALRELFELAADRMRARDTGARVERERIRRDIHDDLGARLLTLLHTTAADSQPLVREALEDLRSLVRALEHDKLTLGDALDNWRAETRKRCDTAGTRLEWQVGNVPEERLLGTRQHANLTRVLREAVSNALRHARPAALTVKFSSNGNDLTLLVHNDGEVRPAADWANGRGRQILQGRVGELGGRADWEVSGGTCLLRVDVPLA